MIGLAFLLDVGSFRVQVLQGLPVLEPAMVVDSVFRADRLLYREVRGPLPTDRRSRAAMEVLARELPHCNNAQYGVLCSFAHVDPCRPFLRTYVLARGFYDMLHARGGNPTIYPNDNYVPAGDESFARSLGCGVPKLRLVARAFIAADAADAIRKFTELADVETAVVVIAPADGPPADNLAGSDPAKLRALDVVSFSSNRLRVRAEVTNPGPVWLVYADAWHPGWNARVDGKAVSVRQANLGLKAVKLEAGTHDVEFMFVDRFQTMLAWCVALIGTASGLAFCGVLLVNPLSLIGRGYAA